MDNQSKDFILHLGTKIDTLNEKVSDLIVISVQQEANLKQHMQRSDALEKQVEFLNDEVKPILEGLKFFKTLGKIASILGSVTYLLVKIFK